MEEENFSTLLGRTEVQGKKYPLWLERIGIFLSVATGILFAYWCIVMNDWNIWIEVGLGCFIAPPIFIALGEALGRLLQFTLAD
ncbi:MAG: hypothetical protein CMB73_00320 [Euryarchaeota archaeon]|nr:hypothetical protein [Euryarchaeota archaeon]